jgi:hypothetical protein
MNISEDVELAVYKELGRLLESDEPKFVRRDQDFDSGLDTLRFVNVVHDDIFSKISSLLHAVHQQDALLKVNWGLATSHTIGPFIENSPH